VRRKEEDIMSQRNFGSNQETDAARPPRTEARRASGGDPEARATGEAAVEAVRAGAAEGAADLATSADEANREAAERAGRSGTRPKR
jgi:hypothetical protein